MTGNTTDQETLVFPASFAQQRLWLFQQLMPDSPAYNISMGLYVSGPLNIEAMQASIDEVVARQESLRTTFKEVEGLPYQVVSPPASRPMIITDLRHVPADQREAEVDRLCSVDDATPFDLERGPLFQTRLFHLDENEYALVLNVHHIIADGWSVGLLMNEIATLYRARVTGQQATLPELAFQYADFTIWQRDQLQDNVIASDLEYWKQQLTELPILELPSDRPRPTPQSFQGDTEIVDYPDSLYDALRTLSRQEGATLFMTGLAAYAALVYRYTGQTDLVFGSPVTGRTRPELEPLIGMFVNMLVLRNDLSGNPTFRELLGRVRESTLAAYAHQDMPFDKLVESMQLQRDASRTPLFQIMYALQDGPPDLKLPELSIRYRFGNSKTSKFDILMILEETYHGLQAIADYSTDLYDKATILRMIEHYRIMLEAIVANPDTRIDDLPLMTEDEREQLLHSLDPWHTDTSKLPTDRTIQEIFEGQAARRPDATAVIYPSTTISKTEETTLTYDQLNRRANQLAHYLRAQGVGPDSIVGIHVERSLEMVVALLGVLKSGAAYLPLNPANPPDRLQFMLEDSGVGVTLTLDRLATGLPQYDGQTLRLDADWGKLADQPEHNPTLQTTNQNRAVVIYTSGSTGKPKGVMLNQSGYLNLFTWYRSICEMDETSRVLLMMSFSFDAALKDIATPLLVGGQLILAPSDDPEEIIDIIDRYQVTISGSTASQLYALPEGAAENDYKQLASLVYFSVGGEPTDVPRIRPWFSHPNCHCRLIHVYGPTECSDLTTTYGPLGAAELNALDKLPIGYPLSNVRVYILGAHGQLQPIGMPGELCVSGAGLARGYLHQPELTAERFVTNPFEDGERLYKTGDMARWRADGTLELMGRIDHQVKIRGLRIELREIELVLLGHEAVRECVVEVREDRPGDKRLVAYVVTSDPAPSVGELRGFVQRKLPEYMVPSFIIFLEALPISPNGKVDRKALPAPETNRPDLDAAFVAPTNAVEEIIAALWAEVLEMEQVGIHDNFFALGGHSLLATQVITRVRAVLQVDVPLRTLFVAPTVSGLSAALLENPAERVRIERLAELLIEVSEMSDEEVEDLASSKPASA